MKIIELNVVEFGCLKNVNIPMDEGMNIICGDNESGKSTVMLFIRFMLYGLPKRSAKSYDRERCLSFDGHRAAGSMTVEHGGRRYKIERTAVGTTKVSETKSIVCLETGETYDKDASELFLGVPAEVFESSCAVSQMRAADISRAQAAGAVENILVSADESIDVKKILEKLDKVRKEYKLNKGDGGLLYDTQQEISSLTAKRREAVEKQLRFGEQRARLERKERELAGIEDELAESEAVLEKMRAAATLERFERLEDTKKSLAKSKAELEALGSEYKKMGSVPDENHVFALRSALGELYEAQARQSEAEKAYNDSADVYCDNILADVGAKIEQVGGVQKIMRDVRSADKKSRYMTALGVVFACLSVFSGVGAAMMISLVVTAIAAAIALGSVIVTVGGFVSASRHRKKRDAVAAEYGQSHTQLEVYLCECIAQLENKRRGDAHRLAAKIKLESEIENTGRAEEKLRRFVLLTASGELVKVSDLCEAASSEIQRVEAFCVRREEMQKQIYALEALCDSDAAALEKYDERALRIFVGEDALATDMQSMGNAEKLVKFNKAKLATLSLEVANLRESQAALGAGLYYDPIELGDRIEALERKLENDTRYFDALVLAKQSIEQASVSMSGNFTPELSRRAGEMLSLISGGKHMAAQTNKSLDLSVEQDGFNVSAEMLSGGTRDAAYLCLRIALMIRLFGDDLPPLLLDETLCQLDDGRAAVVITLLDKLCAELGLQVLLFTCHTREMAICENRGIKTNGIRL
jgi:uncharacterized protein YhaN